MGFDIKAIFIKVFLPLAGVGIVGEGGRYLRKKGQKKLQEKVDETAPVPVEKSYDGQMEFQLVPSENIDLSNCEEININNDPLLDKVKLSELGGESLKTLLTMEATNGLLKCDVPLKYLVKAKDNPNALRGLIMHDGKISGQATFTEVGLGQAAPLLIFQFMAAITSQYYQHINFEKLVTIEGKLTTIIEMLEESDRAVLTTAHKQCYAMSKKSQFDESDKSVLASYIKSVSEVREKYWTLISKIDINNLKVNFAYSDKNEVLNKTGKLKENKYIEKVQIAIAAESLLNRIYILAIKVACFLGKGQDAEMYASQVELNFWDKYVDKFNRIKHDVIKYIELQESAAYFNVETITTIKKEQIQQFEEVELLVRNLEMPDVKSTLYLQQSDDGTVKAFVPLSNA